MEASYPDHAYEPLTPVAFLHRSRDVFGDRVAVVDGAKRFTYRELFDRCARLAGAVRQAGCRRGSRVAFLASNSHQLLEGHYGLAMAGVTLVALNTRLAPAELAAILESCRPELLIATDDLRERAADALRACDVDVTLIDMDDYEQRLEAAAPLVEDVEDEMGLISLNYTSGTTGSPKGVMYHHRGAYLQALAMVVHARLDVRSVYLWTLPMFHCNGWAFTWAVTAAGGTHVCMPRVDGDEAWRLIEEHGVTHLCAAPTVLTTLASARTGASSGAQRVHAFTGGAAPTPTILSELRELSVDVTHLYGLTESFGPSVACEWQPEWDGQPRELQADLVARQGVANILGGGLRVVDDNGQVVPGDGSTMGEVQLRGNNIMLGYLDSPDATRDATAGGWFHTGDLAVVHADGYIEIRDRAKDIIVSGGENISSLEVERALAKHPAVLEAAVVAMPDERWGERPRAHVTLRPGWDATEAELRAHVREHLAGYKVPDEVRFGELPKTSTGKIEKSVLRA